MAKSIDIKLALDIKRRLGMFGNRMMDLDITLHRLVMDAQDAIDKVYDQLFFFGKDYETEEGNENNLTL